MTGSIISTDKAKCRDCYRCVRVCPVKAIRLADGQARVDPERCILCGTCVRECPQSAKHVRNDLDALKVVLSSDAKKIASVAPSFPAAFPEYGGGLLPAALRKLGFDLITETAVGAELVAAATRELLEGSDDAMVTSACPVVDSLIEMYYPESHSHITPLVSPMIAHGRYLKAKYGPESKVVFIGPCCAKKEEAEREAPDIIDVVLTYEELREVFAENGITNTGLSPVNFDDVRPKNAQLFPLEGGLAKTASIESGLLSENFAAISGKEPVMDMIAHLSEDSPIRLFEALFCPGGCINGACVGSHQDIFARRAKVLQFHRRNSFEPEEEFDADTAKGIDLRRGESTREVVLPRFSEEQIRQVLLQTGKHTLEDELNCGSCGYTSCRENALAVLSGMAEHTMCIPWMRQLAETKANQVILNSPNGIVIVDEKLNIVSFNPAFATMFSCTDTIIGRPISTLMDPGDFEKVAAEVVDEVRVKPEEFPEYGLVASVSIYRIADEKVLVGIFVNITKPKENENRIARMRAETLQNAQQVIERQMRMAQEIASILGETTSETRVLLRKLTDLAKETESTEGGTDGK